LARRTLTTEMVVTAAGDLADEVGYYGLTLAAVAQRVRVAPPSLYQHVDGLEDLRRRLAAQALWEFADDLRSAALGKARGDALAAVASAYQRWARQHPGRYTATIQAADLGYPAYWTASQRAIEALIAMLDGYGIHGDDAVDAMRAIRSTLHGFVELDSRGTLELPRTAESSFERLVTGLDSALRSWAEMPVEPTEKV
jgi:AcrR family transcriptional regulator